MYITKSAVSANALSAFRQGVYVPLGLFSLGLSVMSISSYTPHEAGNFYYQALNNSGTQTISSSAELTAIWLSRSLPLINSALAGNRELPAMAEVLSLGKGMRRVNRCCIWPVSGFNTVTGCMRRWLLRSEMWEAFAARSETLPRQ